MDKCIELPGSDAAPTVVRREALFSEPGERTATSGKAPTVASIC
ncbi:hypothetical protein [Variovorax gossypii]